MSTNKSLLNEKLLIKAAMAESGESVKSLANKMGISATAIYSQVNRRDSIMSLTSVFNMLDAMGFELVMRDRGGKYGGVEYMLKERTESDDEFELEVMDAIAAAKKRKIKRGNHESEEKVLATVKINTTDRQIETVQVVNAVTEPKKQSGEQPFDFSLKKTDEQLELENAPTFKGKVIQTPDTAIKAAARIARLNDDLLFNKYAKTE